jgi:hypothetical protein
MKNQYKVIKSDKSNNLTEGQTVTPYYEDNATFILAGGKMDHHVKKNGEYFAEHFEIVGGK